MNTKMKSQVLAVLLACGLELSPVQAGIVATTGGAKAVDPPKDARTGYFEHDTEIRVFVERCEVKLEKDIEVDISKSGKSPVLTPKVGRRGRVGRPTLDQNLSPSTITTDIVVNSYLIHFDKVGGGQPVKNASGSVQFDEEILGIIVTAEHLNATHSVLGSASTTYPSGKHQGPTLTAKGGRSITLSPDRRTLTLDLASAGYGDNVRVVTAEGKGGSAGVQKKPERTSAKKEQKEQPKGQDPLPEGTSWSGTYRLDQQQGSCDIEVTQRNGDRAVLVMRDRSHWRVRWDMRIKGNSLTAIGFEQEFSKNGRAFRKDGMAQGRIANGQLQLDFSWIQDVAKKRANNRLNGSAQFTLDNP